MPKKSKEQIIGEYYIWNLIQRNGVYYADGRGNSPTIGKHSLGTRDRNEALKNIRELDRRQAVARKLIQPEEPIIRPDGLPIDVGWERYLNHCNRPQALGGVGSSTLKRYRAVRDKHLKFCGETSLGDWSDVGKRSLEQYGAWLKAKKYSDASLYLECTLLKQIVKWLIEGEKLLPESHRIRLPLRRSGESDTYCYSQTQLQTMIDLCRSRPDLAWVADVILTLATTGLRIGELVELRWTDINPNCDMINLPDNRHSGRHSNRGAIRTTKGRYSRRVPIHPDLRALLANLPRRTDGRVFGGSRGGVLKPDKLRTTLIRDVLTPLKGKFPTSKGDIGFEHGRLHSFRHYFVSMAFLGGASEGEIREWVGHTDSRIVERYRHLRGEDAQRKMAAIQFLGDHGAAQADPANRPTTKTTGSGNRAAAKTSENSPALASDVPKPRQGQNSDATTAMAQQEESQDDRVQNNSI